MCYNSLGDSLKKKTNKSTTKKVKKTKKSTSKPKSTKQEIVINVLNHFLNPKARIISNKEKKELLTKYNINEGNLPKIFETDPLVKALKAKKGDVIEFIRNDGTGEYLYYRLVI